MLWLDLVVLAFAVARISNLLVNEEGPGHIFTKMRVACGIYYDAEDHVYFVYHNHKRKWLGEILNCVYCCGMWVAIGVWAIYFSYRPLGLILFVPFAIAQGALLILKRLDG